MRTLIAAFLIIICIPVLGMGQEFKIPNYFNPKDEIEAEKFTENYKYIEEKLSELKSSIDNASSDLKVSLNDFRQLTYDLNKKIANLEKTRIPTRTVAAFNLRECPTGWSPFDDGAGRVIIGVGKGKGLTEKKLGETGGEEKIVLTEAQMPEHWHYVPARGGGTNIEKTWALKAANQGNWGEPHDRRTDERGKNQPHNNMPPFITLLFCQKD
jgi:hypothetical protein